MADLKISQLTSATLPLAGTEVLPIVQSSSNRKVATDDLTVKNVRSNATTGILQVAGPAAGATRIMTTPDANFTAARTDAAQSFTGDQTLATGNLVQGTAAKGINFTANTPAAGMTSRLLNWYEEGTWTPAYTNATPPTTPYTTTVASATYTRIGRQVTVRAWIYTQNVDITGAAGALQISGLPFASAAGSAGYSAMAIGQARAWAVAPSYGYVDGSVIALMWRAASNADDQTALATNLTAGATANRNQLMFTATYFV